jgi:hypothetical protein
MCEYSRWKSEEGGEIGTVDRVSVVRATSSLDVIRWESVGPRNASLEQCSQLLWVSWCGLVNGSEFKLMLGARERLEL